MNTFPGPVLAGSWKTPMPNTELRDSEARESTVNIFVDNSLRRGIFFPCKEPASPAKASSKYRNFTSIGTLHGETIAMIHHADGVSGYRGGGKNGVPDKQENSQRINRELKQRCAMLLQSGNLKNQTSALAASGWCQEEICTDTTTKDTTSLCL